MDYYSSRSIRQSGEYRLKLQTRSSLEIKNKISYANPGVMLRVANTGSDHVIIRKMTRRVKHGPLSWITNHIVPVSKKPGVSY